jgi:hypothetical protein
MSLEELREDLKRNLAEARSIVTIEQMRDHLVNTLWPFMEAKLDVLDEIDDAVAEIVDQQEDYLQPETAAIFAAVIQSGLMIAAELKKKAPGDATATKLIAQHEQLCNQAVEVLGAITMIPTEDGEDDDEESEDDDEAQTDPKDGAAND